MMPLVGARTSRCPSLYFPECLNLDTQEGLCIVHSAMRAKKSNSEDFIDDLRIRKKSKDSSASLAKKAFQSKHSPSIIDRESDGLIKPASQHFAAASLRED
jgi:hypothetical protein